MRLWREAGTSLPTFRAWSRQRGLLRLALWFEAALSNAQRIAVRQSAPGLVAADARPFLPATSSGGVECLTERRKSIDSPRSRVPAGLPRLSVGIADADAPIADREPAMAGTRG